MCIRDRIIAAAVGAPGSGGAIGRAPGSKAKSAVTEVEQPQRQIEEGPLKGFLKKVMNKLLDLNALLNAIAGALSGAIVGGAVGLSAVLFRRAFRVRRKNLRPRPS